MGVHRVEMKALSTSETPVSFYETTQLSIPEDRYLHVPSSFTSVELATSAVQMCCSACL